MLIRLPDLTEESADYTLTVEQLAAGQTEGGREVLALELDENQKLHLSSIRTERDNGLLQIRSERSETGTPYALVQVPNGDRSEEHTSELQSRGHLVCRLLLEKKTT